MRGLAYGGGRSDRHPRPGRQLPPLPERGAGLLREHRRDRLGIPGGGPAPVPGAPARPGAWLGERAPRRLSEVSSLRDRHRGVVPGRRGHERHPPGPRRRRAEDRPGQAQRRALLLSDDRLVVRGAVAVRHRDRAAGAALRDHPGTAAPRAAPPAPARLRDHLLGRASGGADADPDRDRDRGGGAGRDPLPSRRVLLAAGQAGTGDLPRADPIRARGRGLAAGRLAVPVRLVLALPRGLPRRRLGPERAPGDERPVDHRRASVHPGRSGRAAGAPGGHARRSLARGRPLLLGRPAARRHRLVGAARVRSAPLLLPNQRLARPDPRGRSRPGDKVVRASDEVAVARRACRVRRRQPARRRRSEASASGPRLPADYS